MSATGIFIMPPSFETLRRRLEGRRLDDTQTVSTRLAVSLWELRRYDQYQYVIINDDAGRASRALASIILARRQRVERMHDRGEAIVADFQDAFQQDAPPDNPSATAE